MYSLVESREAVNKWMERYGVRFGIYKNGTFKEQLFPFDPIPRVISPEEWEYLEKGLALYRLAEILEPEIILAHPVPEQAVLGFGVCDNTVKVK